MTILVPVGFNVESSNRQRTEREVELIKTNKKSILVRVVGNNGEVKTVLRKRGRDYK